MAFQGEIFLHGRSIKLGKRIGKGGEGEVFELADGHAVKIYSKPDFKREAKVKAMVAQQLAKNTSLISFPSEVATDKKGRFLGFKMRLVKGHTSLHELYAPGSRKVHFPKADFRFTVRAASNIARAVAAVHELGAIIGDINHSGILISDQAVAALIDADSFQLGASHLCRVGVPEYTPPELQGQRLDGVVRTTNHDAFGLAVVIFQLLFMGRHPFMGRYTGGDITLEQAIAQNRFVYSRQRSSGMQPPPGACALTDFPPFISDALERAFAPNARARPTPKEWVAHLSALEKALTKCSANPMHFYPSAAPSCTWCRMERALGLLLFIPPITLPVGSTVHDPGVAGFNLGSIWAAIDAIKIPNSDLLSPPLPAASPAASNEAKASKRRQFGAKLLGFCALSAAIAILANEPSIWFLYLPLGWFGLAKALGDDHLGAAKFRTRYDKAELNLASATDLWRKRIGIEEMHKLKQSLNAAKVELERLPQLEKARLAEHEALRRDVALHDYFETFSIRRADISGLGPAKIAALASYGIDTAADVVRTRLLAVPGFGDVNIVPLLKWREKIEKRFVFNIQPTAADLQDRQRILQNCSLEGSNLRLKLMKGLTELKQLSASLPARLAAPDAVVNSAYMELEQAKADLIFLGVSVPTKRQLPQAKSIAAIQTPQRTMAQGRTGANSTASSNTYASCPTCGGRMVKRLARRGRNAGQHFWGCAAYPRCRGTRSI